MRGVGDIRVGYIRKWVDGIGSTVLGRRYWVDGIGLTVSSGSNVPRYWIVDGTGRRSRVDDIGSTELGLRNWVDDIDGVASRRRRVR